MMQTAGLIIQEAKGNKATKICELGKWLLKVSAQETNKQTNK